MKAEKEESAKAAARAAAAQSDSQQLPSSTQNISNAVARASTENKVADFALSAASSTPNPTNISRRQLLWRAVSNLRHWRLRHAFWGWYPHLHHSTPGNRSCLEPLYTCDT